jgi:hypothetical protein
MVVLRLDMFRQLSSEVSRWSNDQLLSSEPIRGIMLGRAGLVWINKKVEQILSSNSSFELDFQIGGRRAILLYAALAFGSVYIFPSVAENLT